ncbi:MAG: tRNA dihydrouridine(20/20a) synthase DusA [Alphaproteobacteria bacterium]|nr:tRNA dihydrouridine(20/20a) synthase DusA [Alphaproteobacteria bacterium]
MSAQMPEISVAPMMDWTDRHCRFFLRLIAPHVKLYTEMVTTGAIIHGDRDRFLRFNTEEHPVALQLGGSNPEQLAECARIGEDYGYDEININCGCPSDRVQNGFFGACLMGRPDLVAECVEAMSKAVSIPVTVKCRIGIDDKDSFEFLADFVDKSVDAGCKTFIIHARKAWLSGLSPKENREIPPLDYTRVFEIKQKYPGLRIILNGGLNETDLIKTELTRFDGAMIGREAYQNPYFLADLEREVYGALQTRSRHEIAHLMADYAERQNELYGTPVKSITRHILGLFHGESGAKDWKRTLSTLPYEEGAGPDVIMKALESVDKAREKHRIVA